MKKAEGNSFLGYPKDEKSNAVSETDLQSEIAGVPL